MKDLRLNYEEVGYVACITSEEAKTIFCQLLDKDKVSKTDSATVEELNPYIGRLKSVDPRYDGEWKLEKILSQINLKFQSELKNKPMIKKLKFTGGKKIFYKVLNQDQLSKAEKALGEAHIHLYGMKSFADTSSHEDYSFMPK
jgi:hypothetical protein